MIPTVRIGGVPEHFNLPWMLAIEEGAFERFGTDVEWVEQPGGTGEIMRSLADGTIDMGTPLTEGAVTSLAEGNPARIVAPWVESPLLWGVHVAAASDVSSLADVADGRFAISRFGSGSELMSRVLAENNQWPIDDDRFVVVGDLDGALTALPAGDAEIFLWNKSMTQPHVDAGTLRRIDILPTPWPSFAMVAGPGMQPVPAFSSRLLIDVALARAAQLVDDPNAADLVADRFGLARADAVGWLDHVRWASPGARPDLAMLGEVADRMRRLGRIDHPVDPLDLVTPIPT